MVTVAVYLIVIVLAPEWPTVAAKATDVKGEKMKKLLLIIKEDIVAYARIFDSAWIDKTNPVFPYRNNDATGNP